MYLEIFLPQTLPPKTLNGVQLATLRLHQHALMGVRAPHLGHPPVPTRCPGTCVWVRAVCVSAVCVSHAALCVSHVTCCVLCVSAVCVSHAACCVCHMSHAACFCVSRVCVTCCVLRVSHAAVPTRCPGISTLGLNPKP